MTNELLLGVPIVLITAFLLVLRINGGIVFFSVSVGNMLASKLGSEASLIGSMFIKNNGLDNSIVLLILILVPIALSILFTRGTVKGGKMVLNVVPCLSAVLLTILVLAPILPDNFTKQVLSGRLWAELEQLLPVILVVGVISSLVLFRVTKAKEHGSSKKHKKS